jgi:hypothetical protein
MLARWMQRIRCKDEDGDLHIYILVDFLVTEKHRTALE